MNCWLPATKKKLKHRKNFDNRIVPISKSYIRHPPETRTHIHSCKWQNVDFINSVFFSINADWIQNILPFPSAVVLSRPVQRSLHNFYNSMYPCAFIHRILAFGGRVDVYFRRNYYKMKRFTSSCPEVFK